MSNNPDPLFDRYASMDFSDAKPATAVPMLAQLQAEHGGKSACFSNVSQCASLDVAQQLLQDEP